VIATERIVCDKSLSVTQKGTRTVNEYILESAAIYANAYRNNVKYGKPCEVTLRNHIARKFGAIYAAIICR